jgi:hypothetical protein
MEEYTGEKDTAIDLDRTDAEVISSSASWKRKHIILRQTARRALGLLRRKQENKIGHLDYVNLELQFASILLNVD